MAFSPMADCNKMDTTTNEFAVVVAIDFGTTYSGFAFSFKDNCNQPFTQTTGGQMSEDREPTTVLLNPDKSFHSFGLQAEEDYKEFMQEGEDYADYFYFRRFKMALYKTNGLSYDTVIHDSLGRPVLAMDIISMVIRFLRTIATDVITKTTVGIPLEDKHFLWVITIPAIWADSARQFMREAANRAGIANTNIRLALEPEAASIFCREQKRVRRETKDELVEEGKFEVGFKYILADLGGGTADICVHEIVAGGDVHELYRATGDSLGGTSVDAAFMNFIQDLFGFGPDEERVTVEFHNLLDDFEKKKKIFGRDKNQIVFFLSGHLLDVIFDTNQKPLQDVLQDSEYSEVVSFNPKNGKMILTESILESFFKPAVESIIGLLQEILDSVNDSEVSTLILVGGFSESPYIRKMIQTDLEHLTILQEPEARLAVLKGGTMFGWNQQSIISRKSRFTYGFSVQRDFEDGVHPESLKVYQDGKPRCKGVFVSLVRRGEDVVKGRMEEIHTTNQIKYLSTARQNLITTLYRSTEVDPEYCSEEECEMLGKIVKSPPPDGWPECIEFVHQVTFGETEISVHVFNKETHEEYKSKMEFL